MGYDISTVRAIYDAAQANTCMEAAILEERNALALQIATDPDAGRDIISGTANGLSFQADVSLSGLERLSLLNALVKALSDGVPPSSRAYVRF